ncbi:MAG: XTP/dITP diphosphatase [Promethearchaeota archaeon]
MIDKIYFITGNLHKYEEIKVAFKRSEMNIELIHKDIKTYELQAETLEEVARFKVNSIKDKVNGNVFVEDAGFFVEYPLKGFPGVYSSYVMKTIGNEGIIKLLNGYKTEDTKAYFKAVIAFYMKEEDTIEIFSGEVHGKVSLQVRGAHGFGFDPIFIPNEMPEKTFGELTREEKNKISHRARALEKLISFLKAQNQ